MEEFFDVYNPDGSWRGLFPRRECHGNPDLLHKSVHVVVLDSSGEKILLQKRSHSKDIQPGKWDTAVGGHLALGEDYLAGAKRELREELAVNSEVELFFLFDAQIRNEIESEDVKVFGTELAGPFAFQQTEIDEVRFWNRDELEDPENLQTFTPDLVNKLIKLKETGFYPQK